MQLAELEELIKLVCPHIHGINSDGLIFYKDEATEEQKEAGMAVMNANLSNLSPMDLP